MAIYNQQQLISASNATYFTNVYGGISASAVRDLNYSWISSSALLSGSQTFVGDQIISGNVNITGTFTSSLQTGYIFVGDGSGKTQAVATSSIIANTDTGSLLVTASFNNTTRNITFTKGNNTTFNLGGFATTGSNDFIGDQNITGTTTIKGGYPLQILDGATINLTQNLQGSGSQYPGINIAVDADTDPSNVYASVQLVDPKTGNPFVSYAANSYTPEFSPELVGWIGGGGQNANSSVTAIIFRTGSANMYVFKPTEFAYNVNITGSLTASLQNGYVWVGDVNNKTSLVATSSFVLPNQTGSFATTGSNTFRGNQTITGSVIISSSAAYDLTVIDSMQVSGSSGRVTIGTNGFVTTIPSTNVGSYVNAYSIAQANIITSDELGITLDTDAYGISGWSGPAIYGNNPSDLYPAFIGFQKKSNYTDGRVTILTPLSASAGFTSSLQNGNIWVGNSNNQNTQITTASFIAQITGSIPAVNTGSFLTTASYSDTTKNLTFTKGDASTFNINGLASTGSNTFIGIETIQDAGGNTTAITPYSGSLIFVGKTWTSSSFSHITSSATAATFPNFIFKSNNTTSSLTITGSNNILNHPVAPQTGMKYYVGSNNIFLNLLPQISSSMTQPLLINNNYSVAPVQLRGPVSSSGTWTYSGNIGLAQAFIGSQASPADKLLGNVTIGTNALINSVTVAANKTPLSASFVFSSNQTAFGPNTLNLNSSSLNMFGNIAGNFTLNNNYYYTTDPTYNSLDVLANYLQGVNVTTSGSNSSVPGNINPRFLHTNLIHTSNGIQNTYLQNASSSIALNQEGIASSLVGTLAVGLGFVITGSNAIQANNVPTGIISGSGAGSAFLGRYNASDGIRDKSAENILVVGTGTSYSNRKTGFLIDSGSNTFVEGTFNVSGSSSMTGSVAVTGNQTLQSYTILSNVSASLNFADDTAAAAGGVPLGGLYRNGNFVMIRLT